MSRPQTADQSFLSAEMRAFLTRLHFYIGLFVGPFIFVAALSGTLYVLTPQLENYIFRDYLTGSIGENQSLEKQVNAARAYLGPDASLFAVRPAPNPGATTRVMFADPKLGESETRAVFVDPVSLQVKGDLVVYGTSGVLPLRLAIDVFHRNLWLGAFGRNYSELAASWLWIATLGGVTIWLLGRRVQKAQTKQTTTSGIRRLHSTIGLWIAVGLMFLSATGLTWSKYAGDNIDAVRQALNWVTPSVSLKLDSASQPAATDPHAGHADHGAHADHMKAGMMPAPAAGLPDPATLIDQVFATAKAAGIDSPMVEIRPSKSADKAWMVREYDRGTPTQVDTIAIDPRSMTVTSRADFDTFTIIPKLIRWGIDIHMGIKFGLANQLLMIAIGSSLCVSIVYGYVLWWKRRPAPGAPARTLIQSWLYLGGASKAAVLVLAIALGFALPLMGLSLLAFVLVDAVRWRLDSGRRAGRKMAAAPAE